MVIAIVITAVIAVVIMIPSVLVGIRLGRSGKSHSCACLRANRESRPSKKIVALWAVTTFVGFAATAAADVAALWWLLAMAILVSLVSLGLWALRLWGR
jgi:hypothetical protein